MEPAKAKTISSFGRREITSMTIRPDRSLSMAVHKGRKRTRKKRCGRFVPLATKPESDPLNLPSGSPCGTTIYAAISFRRVSENKGSVLR